MLLTDDQPIGKLLIGRVRRVGGDTQAGPGAVAAVPPGAAIDSLAALADMAADNGGAPCLA